MKKLVAALLFFAAAAAHAQYPQRPIQLIVPWGAGGGTDATARIIAHAAREGSEAADQRRQPHRRLGRGRPRRDRQGGARRLHDRPDHGRDHDDAPRRPHRAQAHRLHADRAGECRPGGVNVRADSPYKIGEGSARRDQGESRQAEGLGHRPGRHLAPRDRRAAQGPGHRPGRAAVGAVATAPRPACRTWSPAASRSCPARFPRRAR